MSAPRLKNKSVLLPVTEIVSEGALFFYSPTQVRLQVDGGGAMFALHLPTGRSAVVLFSENAPRVPLRLHEWLSGLALGCRVPFSELKFKLAVCEAWWAQVESKVFHFAPNFSSSYFDENPSFLVDFFSHTGLLLVGPSRDDMKEVP